MQGVTIGKGFAGVIKRHHFGGQNASHGNSISHRVPGSTGQNQSPARVFPGKRMPGHLGNVRRTIPNLEIVRIDAERQLLLVKGSVPGSSGRDVMVRSAIKGQRAVVKQRPRPRRRRQPSRRQAAAKPTQAAAKPAANGEGPAMELKMVERQGRRRHLQGDGRGVRARLQRGAGAPDRGRLPGERPHRLARAEGPRRGQPLDQEALAAEGHRPRARRHDLQPAVARRRQDLPQLARRELLAQGEPQDVPRRHGLDPVAARARGPHPRGRRIHARRSRRPSCWRRR